MTSVSVCGVLYRVEYPKLAPTLHGECDSDRKVIRIRKDLSDEGYLATLVHEVAHAAIEESSCRFLIYQELLRKQVNLGNIEELIIRLGVMSLLRATCD